MPSKGETTGALLCAFILFCQFETSSAQGSGAMPMQRLGLGSCKTVAFSPDGQWIVTCEGTSALVWRVETGQRIRSLDAHTQNISSAAFSPDSTRVATASEDGTARLWDTKSGKRIRTFAGHTAPVECVTFSPDGTQLLTGGRDKTVRLWDAESGQRLANYVGHTDDLEALAFSPTGDRILSGSGDRTAKLWDRKTGNELQTFTGHTRWISAVAYSPDGTQVLTGSDDRSARLWDISTGTQLRMFLGNSNGLRCVAFSPSGDRVLTGSRNGMTVLWDASSGEQLREFTPREGTARRVAFSSNGDRVFRWNGNIARFWDAAAGDELFTFERFRATGFSAPPQPEIVSASAPPTLVKVTGTVQFTREELPWSLMSPSSLHAADLDNDGDVDLLGACRSTGEIVSWRSTQNRREAWETALIGQLGDSAERAVSADIDGDGDSDVLGSGIASNMAWFENTDGRGTRWNQHEIDASPDVSSFSSVDMDGDGDLDILGAVPERGEIAVWTNVSGHGMEWEKRIVDSSFITVGNPQGIDIDGDGDTDVISVNSEAGEIAWWSNENGRGDSWSKRAIIASGVAVREALAADVDGDGDTDIVATASTGAHIAWWENAKGNGSEWTKHGIESSFPTLACALAVDVDGDGDTDIVAAAKEEGKLSWWKNLAGDGSEWKRHNIDIEIEAPNLVAAGDIDRDGLLDIFCASSRSGSVYCYKNASGGGTPPPPNRIYVDESLRRVETSHLVLQWDLTNAEQITDVNFIEFSETENLTASNPAEWTGGVARHPRNSRGMLTPGIVAQSDSTWEVLSKTESNAVIQIRSRLNGGTPILTRYTIEAGRPLIRVDRILTIDLERRYISLSPHIWRAYPRNAFTQYVYPNRPGSLARGTPEEGGRTHVDWLGTWADLYNPNDDIGIALFNVSGKRLALHTDMDAGSFTSFVTAQFPPDSPEYKGRQTLSFYYLLHSGDHSDAQLESLYQQLRGDESPLKATGLGEAIQAPVRPQNDSLFEMSVVDGDFVGAVHASAADMDGDGDIDTLGAAMTDSDISWWENLKSDGRTWEKNTVDAEYRGARNAIAADVDGDGDLDILGCRHGTDCVVWWENADGKAKRWQRHVIDRSQRDVYNIAVADMDRDGDVDVVSPVWQPGGFIVWWENSGNGREDSWVEHRVTDRFANARAVDVGDIDGDGQLDIVAASDKGECIAWWKGGGDSEPWIRRVVNNRFFAETTDVHLADVDRDGDLDVLGTSWQGQEVAWWENTRGNGKIWTKHVVARTVGGACTVHTADLDGDTDIDVIAAANNDDTITYWENLDGRGGTWKEVVLEDFFDFAFSVDTADVNGDGYIDILGSAHQGQQIAWWLNNRASVNVWEINTEDGYNTVCVEQETRFILSLHLGTVAATHPIDRIVITFPEGFTLVGDGLGASPRISGVTDVTAETLMMGQVLQVRIDPAIETTADVHLTFDAVASERAAEDAEFAVELLTQNVSGSAAKANAALLSPGNANGIPTDTNGIRGISVIGNEPLPQPSGITASRIEGENDVAIRWEPSEDERVRGYGIFADGKIVREVLGREQSQWTHVNLQTNTTVSYTVVAVAAAKLRSASSVAAVVTIGQDMTPPGPLAVRVNRLTAERVQLDWDSMPGDTTGYVVFRGQSMETLETIAATDLGVHRHIDSVTDDFAYAVGALDDCGNVSPKHKAMGVIVGHVAPAEDGFVWTDLDIAVENREKPQRTETSPDGNGRFRFWLPPGAYRMKVKNIPEAKPIDVELSAGERLVVDFSRFEIAAVPIPAQEDRFPGISITTAGFDPPTSLMLGFGIVGLLCAIPLFWCRRRVVGVFLTPSRTFREIAENPDLVTPVFLMLFYAFSLAAVVPWTLPDKIYDSLTGQSEGAQFIVGLGLILCASVLFSLGLHVAWFVQAGVIWLCARLLGERARFYSLLSAVGYTQLPAILLGGAVLFSFHALDVWNSREVERLMPSSLGYWFPDFVESLGPVGAVLGPRVELFTLWSLALVCVGIVRVYSMRKSKAILMIYGYWLLVVAVWVGIEFGRVTLESL